MRKTILLMSLTILISHFSIAQNIKPLGIALEGYDYPYAVEYIHLDIQGESLQMAYMDVKPEKPNGKSIMLMHGKNFCGA
ncbi:hypothetical protein [Fulvivirga sediminis]|uniref:hypothetical protein n=1 Tax=Fulvivirga sediminis TaxID=2803949 RepID=UPI001F3ACD5C|nr:hypothetical protein [Fulvivirga sediminis]